MQFATKSIKVRINLSETVKFVPPQEIADTNSNHHEFYFLPGQYL